jgi:hypothetical protein
MKILKLFLLLILGLWADVQLDMPNIQSNVVNDVIKGGWEKADDDLRLLFSTKGSKFINDFYSLVEKPLKEQSDEAYLRESILAYSEPSMIEPEEFGLPPRVTEDKHLKLLKLTIKYDLKFMKYKRIFERDTYSYLMAYVKFLEDKKMFTQAYDLYMKVIDRLVYVDKTVDITMLNAIRKIVFNSIIINAFKESTSHKYYTDKQIAEISTRLRSILMLDEKYWEQVMLEEKRRSLAYIKIAVLEVENFEEFLEGVDQEKLAESNIFKDLDYVTLKKYFENKRVMRKSLDEFSKKIDSHLEALKKVKVEEDFLNLEKNYKKDIEIRTEKFEKKVGEGNKYKLSEKEFIDFASEIMYGYSRFWKKGRNKTDFIQIIEKNKIFLQALH